MSNFPLEVIEMMGQTMATVVQDAAVPCRVRLHAPFAAPHILRRRPLEVPRDPELDARPVQICAGDAGVPPLASRFAGRGRQHRFRGPPWDIPFGTFRMPENKLPDDYGVDDQPLPSEIGEQLAYPFCH